MNTKLSIIASCISIMLTLVACNNETKDIEHMAMGYLQATSDYNIEEACKYAVPETANGLHAIEKTLLPMLDPEYIKKNTPATINIVSTTITSDTSANVVYHKKTPISDFTDSITMVKRGNFWMAKIHIKIPPIIAGNESSTRNPDGSITTKFNYDSIGPLHIAEKTAKKDTE
ncbi:MAG: hypothetical protein IJ634_01775 [Bacteroidales bacterium]|nr:hypothetical protein [Bacteroidales bacterium]